MPCRDRTGNEPLLVSYSWHDSWPLQLTFSRPCDDGQVVSVAGGGVKSVEDSV